MANMAKLVVTLDLDNGGFVRGLNATVQTVEGANKSIEGFGSRIAGVFKGAAATAAGFVIGQAVLSITRNVGQLVQTGLDFGKAMANVNSIAQLSDKQFRDLNQAVIDLAQDPRITDAPATLAAGLYQIVSAGFSATDALVILKAAAIAATAGLTDTATAANTITTVLDSYGLSADHATEASNSLFQIVNLGVLSFPQLANSIGNVLPTAAALNVSLDQVGAGLVLLTRHGLDAQTASTYLNGVLVALLKPTADLSAGLAAHGYASGQDALAQLGLAKTVDLVNTIIKEGTGNVTDYVADSRAMRAVLALTSGNGKEYASILKQMGLAQDGTGATAKALAKQMESASFKIAKAKQEVQILATVLVGALSPAIGLVASLMTALVGRTLVPLAEGLQQFLFLMGRAFDQGPRVQTLLASLPGPVRLLGEVFFTAADVLGKFTRAIGEAYAHGKTVQDLIKRFPEPLQGFAAGVLTVADAFGRMVRQFESGGVTKVLRDLPGDIAEALSGITDIGLGTITAPLDIAIDVKSWFLDSVAQPLEDWLAETFGGGNAPSELASMNGTPVGAAGVTLSDVLVGIGSWALGTVETALGDWLQGTFGGGTGGDPTLAGLPVGHTVTLDSVAVEIKGWAITAAKAIGDAVADFATGAARLGKQEIPTLYDYAVRIGGWLVSEAESLAGDVVAFVAGIWPAIKSAGVTLEGYAVGLGAWAISEAESLAGGIVDWLVGVWPKIKDTGSTLEGYAITLGSAEIKNAASDVGGWISDWLAKHPEISATLNNWVLYLNDPSNVTAPDPSGPAGQAINKKKPTLTLLYELALALSGQPTVKGDPNQAANNAINNAIKSVTARVTVRSVIMTTPPGEFLKDVNDALNVIVPPFVEYYPKVRGHIDITKNPIDLAFEGSVNVGLSLGKQIGDKIGNVDVNIPSWNVRLPEPAIGDPLTGGVLLGFSLGQTVAKKIGHISVPVPDWNLDLGVSPTLPDWLTDTSWLSTPVQGLIDTINGLVDDLKAAWSALAFWQDSSQSQGALDIGAINKGAMDTSKTPSSQPGNINGVPVTTLPGVGSGNPMFDALMKAAEDARKAVANSFVGMRNDVTQLATDLANKSTDQFVGLRNNAVTLSTDLDNAVVNQFVGLRNNAVALSTDLNNQVTNQLLGLRGNAILLATATENGVVNAFVGMRNEVASLAASAANAVLDAFAGLAGAAASEGYGIGDALGSGISSGMAVWAGTVANEAYAMVAEAVAAARVAAGAHSPSRKMMELGDDLVSGLLIPLNAGRRPVADAMGGLLTFPGADVGSGSRSGGDTYVTIAPGAIVVNPPPGMDEEAVAAAVMAAFQRELELRSA